MHVLLFFSLFFLSACGNESNYKFDDSNTTTSSISGILVDGYISGALVCLDLDNNSVCDANEPQTTTNTQGEFHLSNVQLQNDAFITILGTSGVDTSTKLNFNEQLKNVIQTQTVKNSYATLISPLTDLVANAFLDQEEQSATSLDSAKSAVSSLLSLPVEQLEQDPMKNLAVFSKVQEIQNIKHFIYSVSNATFNYAITSIETINLQNEIKSLLLTEQLNTANIFNSLESLHNQTFDAEDKDFAILQIQIIRNSLLAIFEELSFEEVDLDQLQLSLATITEESLAVLIPGYVNDDTNSTEPINVASQFSTTDAIYDENACKINNIYTLSLDNSSFSPSASNDLTNGISVKSNYPYDANVYKTQVKIFYSPLEETKTSATLLKLENNYYFSFNSAWILNANNRVYVKTPKDDNGLYSCYRYNLNSTNVSDITEEKVFSYN